MDAFLSLVYLIAWAVNKASGIRIHDNKCI